MLAHLVLAALTSTLTAAQEKSKPIEASRLMSITYGSSSWNTDSTKINTAYLVLRDKNSGRLVQINLEETEPDSSKFNGYFSVNIGEGDKVAPEIFIPPSDIRANDKDNKKLYEMIRAGKLPRKPLIWKKNEKGVPNLDVYDTREQAESALKAYQAEVALAKPLANKVAIKAQAAENADLVAKQLARQMELNKLAMEAAKRESERIRLEQIERQKAEERLREARAMSEAVRAERRAKAEALAREAMALFNQGKFPESEQKFKEAVELDPENHSYYFKYGVTLYRNEKFNDALVILKLAEVDAKSQNEKSYFMGLTYYRLKDLKAAMQQFTAVAQTPDPVMAPSSEFYRGIILYAQEKYEEAKTSFEKVIDTSSDPKLDQQAEEYIENIANQLAIAKLRENKFTFTGTVGAMYDSNVLLTPDNSTTSDVTNVADFRLLTSAGLEYRPVYLDKHELFVNADASLINSLKDASASADPYLFDLTAPYSYKSTLGKKAYKATVKPGYEQLYMATGGSTTKTISFASYFLILDTTFVMKPTWFANYTFEYRNDDARAASFDDGTEDADATKYTLRTNQTVFLDKSRKRALIGSLGYIKNAAKGDNKKYGRIEAGVTFARPWRWDTTWIMSLNVYKLNYPKASTSRDDFDLSLTTGLSKPIKEWLTWGISGTYTKNDSTVEEQEYSKYTIMTTATFVTNF